MKKGIKGTYGYLQAKKIKVLLRTLLFFAVPLTLLIAGIIQTGSKKNLLTVVAVLGFLPACKSMVELIMLIKAARNGCSEAVRNEIEKVQGNLTGMYDMYFTSYQKNFSVSHMVVLGKNICCYTEDAKCDSKAGEAHLNTMLKQGGYTEMTVKIFSDLTKYCERLAQLNSLEHEKSVKSDDGVRALLYEISL